MIGLDTNVLVRYVAQDDAKQAALATRLIERQLSATKPGFISAVVLAELCWVLTRLYGATHAELRAMVEDLLNSQQFHMEHREAVQGALAHLQTTQGKRAGFVDALVAALAEAQGCERTFTFDKGAAKPAGMALLV
jgi:predicted nucleic-acid-binding protein